MIMLYPLTTTDTRSFRSMSNLVKRCVIIWKPTAFSEAGQRPQSTFQHGGASLKVLQCLYNNMGGPSTGHVRTQVLCIIKITSMTCLPERQMNKMSDNALALMYKKKKRINVVYFYHCFFFIRSI